MQTYSKRALLVNILILSMILAAACVSDDNEAITEVSTSDTEPSAVAKPSFIEAAQAAANEASGIPSGDVDELTIEVPPLTLEVEEIAEVEEAAEMDEVVIVIEEDELLEDTKTEIIDLDTVEHDPFGVVVDNIDGIPATVLEATATKDEPVAQVAQTTERQLFDWETQLMTIWDRSINGVVLINLENTQQNSVFPLSGTGAGWFWDDEGHIVTNYHVVRPRSGFINPDAIAIVVETFEGDRFEAEYIGGDPVSDIAIIKIDAPAGTSAPLPLGDSADLRPGMATIALGHPFGINQAFSMTQGIVSGLAREIQADISTIPVPAVIQTDADMNPGNSGGPLLNSSGEVIGVNTQIRSTSNSNSGVGFATPVNLVRRVASNLIENGVHEYSFIGIGSNVLTPALAEQIGLDQDQRGLLIVTIAPDGPADQAGIMPDSGDRSGLEGDGDIIVSIDNVQIDNLYDLRSYIMLNTSPGDVIVVEVLRDDEIVPISITLGSWGDRFN